MNKAIYQHLILISIRFTLVYFCPHPLLKISHCAQVQNTEVYQLLADLIMKSKEKERFPPIKKNPLNITILFPHLPNLLFVLNIIEHSLIPLWLRRR